MSSTHSSPEFSPLEQLRKDLGNRPVRESLEPVRRRSERLLEGYRPDRVVQVVGSNGKGSVVHYLENLLCSTNLNTVAYVSPHLIELRERIHRNGEPLQSDSFVELVRSLPETVHREFTPFERLYLATVKLAVKEQADVLILEAGMGGRWDATSAVPADWTILTSVDREHTQFLGNSLEKILREQLEQVPSESRLLSPVLENSELQSVLREHVENRNLTHVRIGGEREVDELNRHLAVTLARILSGTPTNDLSELLRAVSRPPGRKEVLRWRNRSVVLDVAHTPAAVREWIQFTRRRFSEGERPLFLYGSLRGKELGEITNVLRREIPSENLLLTRPPSPRGLSPDELSQFWTESGESPPFVEPDPKRAWDRLVERADATRTLSVAGSFTLVGYLKEQVL